MIGKAEECGIHPEGEYHVQEGGPCVERCDHAILGRFEYTFARVEWHQQIIKKARANATGTIDGRLACEISESVQIKR